MLSAQFFQNDSITVGDALVAINDWRCELCEEVTDLFEKIAGPPGTLLVAVFRDQSGVEYERRIQRSVESLACQCL